MIDTFVFYPNARFRGDRNYYHSTDCYAHLLEGVETHTSFCCEGPIHVNFRRPLISMPRFTVSRTGESATQSNNCAIDFSLVVNKEKVCGWVEPTDKPITLRQPYCENFVSGANLHENKIVFRYGDRRVSSIEVTTALAMELLRRSVVKNKRYRWLLTRLMLRQPLNLSVDDKVAVEIIKVIGQRFCNLHVTINSETAGTMIFMDAP